jgi:hypothetical protein
LPFELGQTIVLEEDIDPSMAQVVKYQGLAGTYSAKIASGGGSGPVVPNVNPPIPTPPSPLSQVGTWPTYLKVIAGAGAVGAVLLALDKVAEIYDDYKKG